MASLVPVDHDPFAEQTTAQYVDLKVNAAEAAPNLVPVDHDPFAEEPKGSLAGGAGKVASSVDPTWGVLDAAIQGVPVLGPLLRKGGAAGAALVQPLLGQGGDMSFGDRYTENEKHLSGRTKQFSEDHPIASTAAEIAGGTAAFLPLAATAPGAALLGLAGKSLPARVAAGGASGAVIGGADSALEGHNPATGAMIGGGLGAAAPPVGKLVGSALGGARDIAGSILRSGESEATKKAATALSREGITDQTALQQRLGELGPEGMLADLGPNLTQMAGAIAATPGKGQKVVRDALKDRAEGASPRIQVAIDEGLGEPKNLVQLGDEIVKRRSEQAAPLYREAYQSPIKMTQSIADALSTPSGKVAINKAERLSLDEGAQLGSNVRSVDLVKRALDDMVERANRQGAKNKARVISDIRNTIVSEVDQQAPAYARARQVFASESAIRDALEEGQSVFTKKLHPNDLQKMLAGMTEGERESFLQGARGAVADVMATARNDAAAARKLFDTSFNKEKLEMLVGPETAEQVLRSMSREGTFASTAGRATGNSETAARQAGQADISGHALSGLTGRDAFAAGGFSGLGRSMAVRGVDKVLDGIRSGRKAEVQQELAKILTARGDERNDTIMSLMAAARQADKSGNLAVQTQRAIQAAMRGSQSALTD